MSEYRIEGGYPIKGAITASGNKNAALPCIAAALLTDEEVVLRNIPAIEDVGVMFEVLRALGVSVSQEGAGVWRCRAEKPVSNIPEELSQKIRASILFAGPLLARTGRAFLPPPGGDVIGRRRLDTHFLALTELGARVSTEGAFGFSVNKLIGADIFLDEMSVTATENAIMAASLAKGDTVISNAASEPHIQDLCRMLNAMGAKISGLGSNILRIRGVKELHGCDFTIGPDYMEIGSYIGLAAATRGSITIHGVNPRDMRPIQLSFKKLGIRWTIQEDGGPAAGLASLFVPMEQTLQVNSDLGGMIPKIDDAPWPGFPPDLTSIMTVVATQVEGTVLIHEKMFESRMFFVDKLISMGARITLCDPHRAVVTGPSTLHGEHLVSPDVRAGMALVIAAMSARGESVISNIYQVERGYENLAGRLQGLGAHIERA
ncbi:MAG: UDP-N-acetylglucosamine 1-carboxyvinyltransferase [Spirochaetaceae bacterium]|jgi:UDP-N-acetylglucosamine 1-carboxyvinyltransferase|nr:UDP-N-acetylglucosamine 1-carboxyvinyltransferase [Spirochaetaceae bacterium]